MAAGERRIGRALAAGIGLTAGAGLVVGAHASSRALDEVIGPMGGASLGVVVPVIQLASLPEDAGTGAGTGARPAATGNASVGDGELLLELRLGQFLAAQGVSGLKRGDDILLGLSDLVTALDFPIDVDPKTGRADGWFMREDNGFHLDLAKGTVSIAGKQKPIDPAGVDRADFDLLVSTRLLQSWFNIAFTPDLRDLAIKLTPAQPLPVQERLARQQRLATPLTQRADNRPLPRLQTDYEAITWPTVDVTAGPRWQRSPSGGSTGGGSSAGVRHSVVGTGDLAYGNASFFVGGDTSVRNGSPVDTARLTLRRFDTGGGMLGPLGATLVEGGEVKSAAIPLVGGGGYERGARITNQPLGFTTTFDTTDIVGDAPPDWDVELYRNGALTATQRVGADGRYAFTKVDVFLGRNDFRVVLLGPQGQRREEARSIPVGLGMAAPGALQYEFSATQKDTPFYQRGLPTASSSGTARLSGAFAYGLGDSLSASGGFSSVDPGTGRVNYMVGGLAAQRWGVLTAVNGVVDSQGGWGVDTIAQTDALGHSLRATARYVDSLAGSGGATGRQYRAGLSLFRALSVDEGATLSYTVGGEYAVGPGDARTTSAGVRVAAGVDRTSLAVGVNAERSQGGTTGDRTRMTANITGYTAIGDVRLMGRATAQGTPVLALQNADVTAGMPLSSNLWGELNVTRSVTTGITTGTGRLSWDIGKAGIGPRFQIASDGSMEAMLEVTTSIMREPRYGGLSLSSHAVQEAGGVSVRVAERTDDGPPGIHADAGRPVEGVTVMVRQTGAMAVTDADGVAMLRDLPPNTPVDVMIDPGSLKDPYLQPLQSGYSFIPRPGVVQKVDIPVAQVGEVEGRILATAEDGTTQPVRGLPVRLVRADGTVVETQRTAYDGLYNFPTVVPGRYVVEVEADAALKRNLPGQYRREIEVRRDSGLIALGDSLFGKDNGVAMAQQAVPTQTQPQAQLAAAPSATGRMVVVGTYGSQLGAIADILLVRRQHGGLLASLGPGKPRIAADPASGRLAVVIDTEMTADAAAGVCAQLRRDDRPCRIQDRA